MSEDELVALAKADGQPSFRGRQLYDALYGKSNTPLTLDDVVTLPAAWRASLKARGVTLGRSTVHAVAAAADGTCKLLLRLGDGRVVEAVGIPSDDASKPRLTVCVSSQVGCPMRCTFCATGKGGFARNLRPHEIVDQVLQIEAHFGKRASHVVFMGMGEPLLNLRGVLAAQHCLSTAVGIGARKLTISTVGVPNTLARLAESELQVTLAVSLHAPNQALREQLIPSAKVYDMDALLEDCLAYTRRTKRRVTFEYTLLRGVNDAPEHASELARVLKRFGLASHVNLIPYNPVDGAQYARPAAGAAQAFAAALRAGGCGASVRQTRGLDAAAACGMLRNAFQSKAGPLAPVPPLPPPSK
jgi:23S rRNA (adenine2503-C2)-methyltransferase